jgi:hypothetical protein
MSSTPVPGVIATWDSSAIVYGSHHIEIMTHLNLTNDECKAAYWVRSDPWGWKYADSVPTNATDLIRFRNNGVTRSLGAWEAEFGWVDAVAVVRLKSFEGPAGRNDVYITGA